MKTAIVDNVETEVIDYTEVNEFGYARLTCPNCNRSFYWDKKSKVFSCICGKKLSCGENLSSN